MMLIVVSQLMCMEVRKPKRMQTISLESKEIKRRKKSSPEMEAALGLLKLLTTAPIQQSPGSLSGKGLKDDENLHNNGLLTNTQCQQLNCLRSLIEKNYDKYALIIKMIDSETCGRSYTIPFGPEYNFLKKYKLIDRGTKKLAYRNLDESIIHEMWKAEPFPNNSIISCEDLIAELKDKYPLGINSTRIMT